MGHSVRLSHGPTGLGLAAMSTEDPRPPLWVGHVTLESDRLAETAAFMRSLGMRPVFEGTGVAIFELRGGTHLVVLGRDRVKGGDASFDLMVEDLHATHRELTTMGLAPSPIEKVPDITHERFSVRELAGHIITFYSNHVLGPA